MKEEYIPRTRAFVATMLFSLWFVFLYIGISIDEIYGFVVCFFLLPVWILFCMDIAKKLVRAGKKPIKIV